MSHQTIPIGAHAEHEAMLQLLRNVVGKITPEMAANAFLYSLSTRALEYRAVLGSYWYAVAIPDHAPTDTWHCYDCGWSSQKTSGTGKISKGHPIYGALLEVLEQLPTEPSINYGHVYTTLNQCLLVLEHFLTLPPVQHTAQDEALLLQILQCVYALEPHQRGRALQKKITQSRIIKSNAWEIDSLLDSLGICGVLSSDRAPCYAVEFCDEYHRNPETDSQFLYPLNWWRACDGINRERYEIVFGKPYPEQITVMPWSKR